MMRPRYYYLDGHTPVGTDDAEEWARHCTGDHREARRVGLWRLVDPHTAEEQARVSTVFLGIDHNCWGVGRPLLFETRVVGGPLDQEQWRYSTWQQASDGHAQAVAAVRTALGLP